MPPRSRVALVLFLAALLPAAPMTVRAADTPFSAELVDNGEFAGLYTSIALNSRTEPLVAYQVGISGDLRLAHRRNGAWNVETVDGSSLTGFYNSLAIDSQDRPHIAYYDFTNRRLRYAVKTGSTWSVETVDSIGSVGQFCALALDASDRPHISYYDQSNRNLKYAAKFGNWFRETVDSPGVVGRHTSIAVTKEGYPQISYYDSTNRDLKFASNFSGWNIEIVDTANAGIPSALVLDAKGGPHIAYNRAGLYYARRNETFNDQWQLISTGTPGEDFLDIDLDGNGEPVVIGLHRYGSSHSLHYAKWNGGAWGSEVVERAGSVGEHCSLVLDRQGNPVISYYDSENGHLRVADGAVRLGSPSGGEVWPVGALREIQWSGAGTVDLELSVDGGTSFAPLLEGIIENRLQVRVPHAPTRFAVLRVRREAPFSTSDSESLFTIEADIALLSIAAGPPLETAGGALITWQTSPGPEDLSGYRIERATGAATWTTIVSGLRDTRYLDPTGGPGSRYRLFAANGFGAEQLLGEVTMLQTAPLMAWPVPYRGGALHVSFATTGGLGGGLGRAEVALYDAGGRLVRTLASGEYAAGQQLVEWDGRDTGGRSVVPGVYFLAARAGGEESRLKVVVLR